MLEFSSKVVLSSLIGLWVVLTLVVFITIALKIPTFIESINAKETDFWGNITTIIAALIGALMIATSLAVTSYFSYKQIAAVREQINQANQFRIDEVKRLDEVTIVDFEHMYYSYLSFSEHIGFELRNIEVLITKRRNKDVLEKELHQEIDSRVKKTLSSRYPLPERPQYFDRLPPIARSGYSSLLRMDAYMQSHTEYLLSNMNSIEDTKELLRFLKGRSSIFRDNILLIKYGLEQLERKLAGADDALKLSVWRAGFILKPHRFGFSIESLRYPKMELIPDKSVIEMERGENSFTPEIHIVLQELTTVDELRIQKMESTLKSLFHSTVINKNIFEVHKIKTLPTDDEWIY